MIEAELKARLRDPATVERRLTQRAPAEESTYSDTYYDDPARTLTATGRELRIRTKTVGARARHLLTYKDAAVDADSGSKPEHETLVTDRTATDAVLRGLGYQPFIAFTKHFRNYAFTTAGRDILATLVRVPGLDGVFLEIETLVDQDNLTVALDDLRALLTDLAVTPDELTTEQYTDAVAAHTGHA